MTIVNVLLGVLVAIGCAFLLLVSLILYGASIAINELRKACDW